MINFLSYDPYIHSRKSVVAKTCNEQWISKRNIRIIRFELLILFQSLRMKSKMQKAISVFFFFFGHNYLLHQMLAIFSWQCHLIILQYEERIFSINLKKMFILFLGRLKTITISKIVSKPNNCPQNFLKM